MGSLEDSNTYNYNYLYLFNGKEEERRIVVTRMSIRGDSDSNNKLIID